MAPVPSALARFDRWIAEVAIDNGAVALKQNEVRAGFRKQAVEATLTLGDPPKVVFAPSRATQARK
jgi:hypothetical protein